MNKRSFDRWKIAEFIARLEREENKSIPKIAEIAGISDKNLYNILDPEHEQETVQRKTVDALLKAFDYFVKYEGDDPHFYKKSPQGNGKNIDNYTDEVDSIYSEPIRRHETLPPIPIMELEMVAEEGVMYDDLDEAFRENPNNFITRLHGFDDSNAYAFVIRTDQLQPFIKPETVLVASPAAECQSGDLVIKILWLIYTHRISHISYHQSAKNKFPNIHIENL